MGKMRVNLGIQLLSFLIVFSFLPLASASLINGNSIGANGETYEANFQNLSSNFLSPSFNVTQTFTGGGCGTGKTCLWVPWYSSSTFCNVTYLKDYGSIGPGTPNMTVNVMVTDELSEIGLELSQANNQTSFDQFYNTIVAIRSYQAGTLPIWVVSRNGTQIRSESSTNDTASDTTARIGMAMYLAANNTAFTNTTATALYLSLANSMAADHLTYESKIECHNSSISSRQICRWVGGGKDVSSNFFSSPYNYVGYFPDVIKFMYLAYKVTNNPAYSSAATNYTDQYLLAVNYSGGTSSSSFKVAPFNFIWNMTFTFPMVQNDTNVNGYYWNINNPQWDDSDAPRALGVCDVLRVVNLTSALTGTYQNLSDYCSAFSKTNTFTSTTSCLQYYFNGTCYPGTQQSDFYYVGLGGQMHTYYNTSIFQTKLDSAISQYSWTAKTYNSAQCYGVYRGVRPLKLLGIGLGKDEIGFGSPALLLLSDPLGIQINLVSPTNNSYINAVSSLLTVQIINNNVTNTATSSTDPTPFVYNNYTFNNIDEGFTGSFTQFSAGDGYLNLTGDTFSPNMNVARLNTTYEIQYNFSVGTSVTTLKIFPLTPVGTSNGDRYYLENGTGCSFNVKQEPTFQTEYSGIGCNSNVSALITLNKSGTQMLINITWKNNTASGNGGGSWRSFSSTQNGTIFDNGTSIQLSGTTIGDIHLYNVLVRNIGFNITTFTSVVGSGVMNYSFYNSSNFFLGGANGTSSGSQVSANWSSLTDGVHNWFVNVSSKDNRVKSYLVQFTTDTINPKPSIVYPTNTTYAVSVTALNYTVGDINPSSCLYSLNSGVTNVSITCGNNVTGISSFTGVNKWLIGITDLAGNTNSTTLTFTDTSSNGGGGGGGGGGSQDNKNESNGDLPGILDEQNYPYLWTWIFIILGIIVVLYFLTNV